MSDKATYRGDVLLRVTDFVGRVNPTDRAPWIHVGRSTWQGLVKAGKAPPPIQLCHQRATVWRRSDIEKFIAEGGWSPKTQDAA